MKLGPLPSVLLRNIGPLTGAMSQYLLPLYLEYHPSINANRSPHKSRLDCLLIIISISPQLGIYSKNAFNGSTFKSYIYWWMTGVNNNIVDMNTKLVPLGLCFNEAKLKDCWDQCRPPNKAELC